MVEVDVEWIEKMKFVGISPLNHRVVMDTEPRVGGEDTAPRPMEVMLIALGGCTGMDVVSILRKMRVDFDEFHIKIKGERAEEHPKIYTKVEIIYTVKGKDLPEDKIKRAIELSQERYCPISAMIRKTSQLNYSYEVISGT